jgi:hypothetical protein
VNQYWSWALTAIGVTAFYLTSRGLWWSWWINVAGQGVWFTYAIVTAQYGFLVASVLYFWVFWRNAMLATKGHRHSDFPEARAHERAMQALKRGRGGEA